MVAPVVYVVGLGALRLGSMGYKAYKAYRQAKKLKDLKDKADKLKKAQAAAKAKDKPKPQKKVCASCKKEIKCFKKPKGTSDKEFDRQLKEQQDAINRTSADDVIKRRDAIRAAGGTGPLRDNAAQQAARTAFSKRRTAELIRQGKSPVEAGKTVAGEMKNLAATHRLDIIAGGDPSDISGLADKITNRSLGPQWKGARSQELEDVARQMKKEGLGKEKIDIKLKKC
jgi:Novel toxin 15